MRKEISSNPEIKEKIKQSVLKYFENESEEHKQWRSQRIKESQTKEGMLRRREKIEARKEEFKENVRKGVLLYYKNPSSKIKTSEATKKAMNSPEKIEMRKKIKEAYNKQKQELGKNYIRWNEFQTQWHKKYGG